MAYLHNTVPIVTSCHAK